MGNKNMTAGSFDSGLPKDCFKDNNPCTQVPLAATATAKDSPASSVAGFDQEGDDHLFASNCGLSTKS
jgi:hypothetical protein